MKAFCLALTALVLTAALLTVGGIYIYRLTSDVIEDAGTASDMSLSEDERREALESVRERLDGASFVLSLSVGHDEIASLFSYLYDATRQAGGDEGQYLAAIDKLIKQAEKIRITSTFCLDGII